MAMQTGNIKEFCEIAAKLAEDIGSCEAEQDRQIECLEHVAVKLGILKDTEKKMDDSLEETSAENKHITDGKRTADVIKSNE